MGKTWNLNCSHCRTIIPPLNTVSQIILPLTNPNLNHARARFQWRLKAIANKQRSDGRRSWNRGAIKLIMTVDWLRLESVSRVRLLELSTKSSWSWSVPVKGLLLVVITKGQLKGSLLTKPPVWHDQEGSVKLHEGSLTPLSRLARAMWPLPASSLSRQLSACL